MRRLELQDLTARAGIVALGLCACFQPHGKPEETTSGTSSGASTTEEPGTAATTEPDSSGTSPVDTVEPTSTSEPLSTSEPDTSTSTTGTTAAATDPTTEAEVCVCGDGVLGCDEECENERPDCALCKRTRFYAFLSSHATDGTFNGQVGVAGADSVCQQDARKAGLPGTYLAWISSNEVSPASRFIHTDRPYVLPVTMTEIAANYDSLTSPGPKASINIQADGVYVDAMTACAPGSLVWTGTDDLGGGAGGEHCNDWTDSTAMKTGMAGTFAAGALPGHWTQCAPTPCNTPARLYCFEQPWNGE